MKKISTAILSLLSFLLSFSLASAHAIVKPAQVGVAAYQVFTLGVPSEKAAPLYTKAVQLMLPDGVQFVTPNVKAGWQIQVKTQATGKQIKNDDGMMMPEMKPVEIDWSGGNIPAGQRDEFNFQLQVPATETTLPWKVIQTYSDGSTLSWTLGPNDPQPKDAKGNNDFSNFGPYSQTAVVNDLAATATAVSAANQSSAPADASASAKKTANIALTLSIVALAIAVASFARKRQA